MKTIDLDVDCVAQIGLMFLDGDSLEEVLLDKCGHTDYRFNAFNSCKITLMRVERMNRALDATAVLWQLQQNHPEIALPVVAGKALPREGWRGTPLNAPMRAAFAGDMGTVLRREDGFASHYYPVRNTDAEIVGVLELLVGGAEGVDI